METRFMENADGWRFGVQAYAEVDEVRVILTKWGDDTLSFVWLSPAGAEELILVLREALRDLRGTGPKPLSAVSTS